jgi:1,4-dihydroxy-2-naphthoate octaprenyltransferase
MRNLEELKTKHGAKRRARFGNLKLKTLFMASRPQFLTASIGPVLAGSALGFAVAGTFNWGLFLLALFGIMALHAGANIVNDYFDSVSGNDWANKNVTPFSGGRQFIQQGILSSRATLLTGIFCFILGGILGIIILLLTHSIFILILGLAGILGGFFYTAPPFKLGYRGIGEFIIAFLFGILPVYGSYYLQTGRIDYLPLSAGCVIGILIFLVIFVNEFPDLAADTQANKKTLVVRYGIETGVWIYRIAVVSTFLIAIAGVFVSRTMVLPLLLYLLFGIPASVAAFNFVNAGNLSTAGPTQHRACAITIFLHLLGSLCFIAGFLLRAVIF